MNWQEIISRFVGDLLGADDLRYVGNLPGPDGVRLFGVEPRAVADFLRDNYSHRKMFASPGIGNVVESDDGVTRWLYSYDAGGRIDEVKIGPHGPSGMRAILWWLPDRGWFVEEAE